MVNCQHYFFIDLEMIKNFCKSDTSNGHHNNVSQALSQFVVLGRKWFKRKRKLNMMTRDSCFYKNTVPLSFELLYVHHLHNERTQTNLSPIKKSSVKLWLNIIMINYIYRYRNSNLIPLIFHSLPLLEAKYHPGNGNWGNPIV